MLLWLPSSHRILQKLNWKFLSSTITRPTTMFHPTSSASCHMAELLHNNNSRFEHPVQRIMDDSRSMSLSRQCDDASFYGRERKVCKKARNESDYSDDKAATIKARCLTMNFYCMAGSIIIPGRCSEDHLNNWKLGAWLQLKTKAL